jgi:Transcription factor zinc-finger
MDDQKDRFGDKLRDLEKVREDQWARDHDLELLEKMRARQHTELYCPRCAAKLVPRTGGEIAAMSCPNGHGAWLEATALERLDARTK